MEFLRFLTLSILIFLITVVMHADFFAYQKWVHTQTGQEIHEFYDVHETKDSSILNQQQKDFMWMLKQPSKRPRIALVEDAFSSTVSYEQACKMSPALPKIAIQEFGPTPLRFLHSYCRREGICSYNAEIRDGLRLHPPLGEVIKTCIREYNDGPVLNKFYEQVLKNIHVSDTQLVDARMLHKIYNNNQADFCIAAGAVHIAAINDQLIQLGFKPMEPILDKELSGLVRAKSNQIRYKPLEEFNESTLLSKMCRQKTDSEVYWILLTEYLRHTTQGYIYPKELLNNLYHYPINIRKIFGDQKIMEEVVNKNTQEETAKLQTKPILLIRSRL
jgi:hypothetical protein